MAFFRDKQRLNEDHMRRLVEAANQAWATFPGSLKGAVLSYKGAEVNFLDPADREQFVQHFWRTLDDVASAERPMTRWHAIYSALKTDADRFAVSSALVVKAIVLLDMLAEAELQFPKDERVRRMRNQLMIDILSALERYYDEAMAPAIIGSLRNLERVMIGDWDGKGDEQS